MRKLLAFLSKKVTEERSGVQHMEQFEREFGFPPGEFNQKRRQKEVLLRLCQQCRVLADKAALYNEHPDNFSRKQNYEYTFNEHERLVGLIRQVDASFVEKIPHWTELSDLVTGWISDNKDQLRNVTTVLMHQ